MLGCPQVFTLRKLLKVKQNYTFQADYTFSAPAGGTPARLERLSKGAF